MLILQYLNLLMALLKAILALTHNIQKTFQGSFHQAHPKFGETSGIQCVCNYLFSIFWSYKACFIWKSWDLDYVLEYGDDLFKDVNSLRPLSIEELPETVLLNGHVIKVEMLSNINRLLGANNLFDNHKDVLPGNGLIFTTNG